ncbi:putative transmembrane protein 244 [Mobula hypostoma]|uniref:putative transmembrane protein 244 n=1 Tax=Mobula hypostoma TaxID=723540 RepID=UPI002FC28B51
MAFKDRVLGTKTILLNLLVCLLVIYTVYYLFASVCIGAFGHDSFDGLIPFDFKTPASTSSSKYLVSFFTLLVNLLSTELTYFISGLLFAAVVKERVWDDSFTVALNHILLTSAVKVEFPLVWQWCLALADVGLLLMIGNGQLVAHFVCRNNPSYSFVDV